MLRRVVSQTLKRQLWVLNYATARGPSPSVNKQQNRLASSSSIKISHLDHLVLTVKDTEKTVDFYTKVLGMEAVTFKGGRKALNFGEQKINLHEHKKEFEPKAYTATPGSADLCFVTSTELDHVAKHLEACKVEVLEGPVHRTGAVGTIKSLYVRDPDGNLIEISNYTSRTGQL